MYKRLVKPKPVRRNCEFCNNNTVPDYKDADKLRNYMSERGKILGKDRSGLCAKHQRAVAREIKHARHIATLPFTAGL